MRCAVRFMVDADTSTGGEIDKAEPSSTLSEEAERNTRVLGISLEAMIIFPDEGAPDYEQRLAE